jgi:hypothetical protein
MFYKLQFLHTDTSGLKQEVSFYADEMVYIFHHLYTQDAIQNAQNSNTGNSSEALSIPKYTVLESSLDSQFQAFATPLLDHYSRYYAQPSFARLLAELSDDTPLPLVTYQRPPQAPFHNQDNSFEELCSFEAISGANDRTSWMQFHRYFKESSKSEDIEGWWFTIAGRLIRLNKETIYASDCGSLNELYLMFSTSLSYKFKHEPMTALNDLSHHCKNFSEEEREVIMKLFFGEKHAEPRNSTASVNDIFLRVLAESCILKKESYLLLSNYNAQEILLLLTVVPEGELKNRIKTLINTSSRAPRLTLHNNNQPKCKAAIFTLEEFGILCQYLDNSIIRNKTALREKIIKLSPQLDQLQLIGPANWQPLTEQQISLYNELEQRFLFVSHFLVKSYVNEPTTLRGTKLNQARYAYVNHIMHPEDAQRYILFHLMNEYRKKSTRFNKTYNIRGISAYGKKEGDDYRAFAKTVTKYSQRNPSVRNSDFARMIRGVLKEDISHSLLPPFIPSLVIAWFVSETWRCPSSFYTALMLLDLMENDYTLMESGHNYYALRNTLIHPLKSEDKSDQNEGTKVYNLYGQKMRVSLWDGAHPMAHAKSAKQGNADLTEELKPVRQKEASLIIHWLSKKIPRSSGIECNAIPADPSSLSTSLDNNKARVKAIKRLFSQKGSLTDAEIKRKSFIEDNITPRLKERLSNLDDQLAIQAATSEATASLVSRGAH